MFEENHDTRLVLEHVQACSELQFRRVQFPGKISDSDAEKKGQTFPIWATFRPKSRFFENLEPDGSWG